MTVTDAITLSALTVFSFSHLLRLNHYLSTSFLSSFFARFLHSFLSAFLPYSSLSSSLPSTLPPSFTPSPPPIPLPTSRLTSFPPSLPLSPSFPLPPSLPPSHSRLARAWAGEHLLLSCPIRVTHCATSHKHSLTLPTGSHKVTIRGRYKG